MFDNDSKTVSIEYLASLFSMSGKVKEKVKYIACDSDGRTCIFSEEPMAYTPDENQCYWLKSGKCIEVSSSKPKGMNKGAGWLYRVTQ